MGLNIPILRQCIGFVYLTFIPGFVILRALNMKEKSTTETFMLSVALSIAFVMLIGLVINTLFPSLGVLAPLLANPSAVIMTSLTLIIFLFSQRKAIGKSLNISNRDFSAELSTRGVILYALSVLLLLLSIIGALYANTNLIILAIIGTAAFFASCAFSKVIPSKYYTFVLFIVSLSLVYQTSLLSSHIMGWDIFNEYYVFKLVRSTGYWSSPGLVISFSNIANYNSMLSTTVLPTIYSTILNVDGDFIFKVIYPFILAFVPLFLYKTYESQLGKLFGMLSAFFFIANPFFYGLESLGFVRETIGYLFMSAALFSLLNEDMSTRNKRILFIIFSAGVAVSAYSLSFIYVFVIVFAFAALRVSGERATLLNLSLVITILAIIFAWYMFVSTPPLNKLSLVVGNIFQRFTQDLFSSQARLDPAYSILSPTAKTTFVGLFHKLLVYLTQGFIVVGAVLLALRPKRLKFSPEFRWMVIISALILIICLAVPNVAPTLNFARFYRASMIFLSPLYVVGGIFVFDSFKRIGNPSRIRFYKVTYKSFELLMLAIIVATFFLFRVGFANYVSGGYPISYSLNFNDMQKSTDLQQRISIYGISIPEPDFYSARWLASRIENNSTVYADETGVATMIDYTSLSLNNTCLLSNNTEPKTASYVYLRGFNVIDSVVSFDLSQGYPQYNISDISPIFTRSDKIYSNGQSEVYYVP
jgi:uncharacterized membrane protein